jgi:hypothetical protein
VESEPDGVRNAKNQLSTGVSEIDSVKVTPTFREGFGRPVKLMSEWTATDGSGTRRSGIRTQPPQTQIAVGNPVVSRETASGSGPRYRPERQLVLSQGNLAT